MFQSTKYAERKQQGDVMKTATAKLHSHGEAETHTHYITIYSKHTHGLHLIPLTFSPRNVTLQSTELGKQRARKAGKPATTGNKGIAETR